MKIIKVKDIEKDNTFDMLESVYNDHYKESERYKEIKEISEMSLVELKELAREKGLDGYSNANKEQLLNALTPGV